MSLLCVWMITVFCFLLAVYPKYWLYRMNNSAKISYNTRACLIWNVFYFTSLAWLTFSKQFIVHKLFSIKEFIVQPNPLWLFLKLWMKCKQIIACLEPTIYRTEKDFLIPIHTTFQTTHERERKLECIVGN